MCAFMCIKKNSYTDKIMMKTLEQMPAGFFVIFFSFFAGLIFTLFQILFDSNPVNILFLTCVFFITVSGSYCGTILTLNYDN